MPANGCNISSRQQGARQALKRAIALACMLLLAASCVLCLSGCKDSRSIKEIIHDQDSDKIDYESGETYQVVDANGRFVSEDTGLYEIGPASEALPVNLLYVSSDPETELPTSRFVYDPNSTNHSEATDNASVDPPEDQQSDWENTDVPQDSQQQSQSQSTGGQSTPGVGGAGSGNATTGDTDTDDDSQGDATDTQDPGTDSETGPTPEDDNEDDDEDDEPQYYDATGADPELPDSTRIAAFGEVAVLVQMLGGTDADGGSTPLVAADDELCSGAFSRVFSDEGASSINSQAFHADGSGGYEVDIDQIIASQPDTVLVFTTGMFTKAEKRKLKNNGISVTTVPRLTSDTKIMKAAQYIAQMLDESTDGRSTSVYEDYKSYHDDLVAAVEYPRGYGAYLSVVYDESVKPSGKFTAQKFTLVINEWDYNASYNYQSTLNDAGVGVGLCSVGYRSSPVSYYLGVAGVVNTAAAIDTTKNNDGLLVPAWQFSPNELDPTAAAFSSSYSSRLYSSWGTGATKTTLAKPSNKAADMYKVGLGTDTFPAIIVTTQRMKQAFLASANASDGIYHPFGFITSPYDMNTFHGALVGRKAVYSAIDEGLNVSASTSAVLVNPHGLFSSWIQGSAESMLECAWAASIQAFESDWSGSISDEVKSFYQTFYRYSISNGEVEDILDGLSG